jgi:non-homologous end joining protein Ku
MEFVAAPRAYWKGYLKLSLVSCPVALFPASSEREKISFNQINKKTGNRIRYRKVDGETGDEVDSSEIIKATRSAKANTLRSSPKSSRPLPSRASAQSRSTSSCLRKKSTSFI